MKVWEMFRTQGNAGDGSFISLLKGDQDVTARLTDDEIDGLFDDEYHLKYVDAIFSRVF